MNRPKRNYINESSLLLMGVPKKFVHVTLQDFKTYNDSGLYKVKEFVSDYINNITYNLERGKGILFVGSNGVGKTMLSCLILKSAYTYRYSCRRVTFSKYIDEYTKSWNKSGAEKEESQQEVFEVFKSVEFLILEEIGKEIDSKIAKPILEDLLRYREEKGLTTIICTNLSKKVFKEDYGESIFSILTGSMTPITIVGKDRREEVFNRKE